MPYNYFCTYCGRELTQDIVLFDMQPILIQNKEERFNTVSFCLTKSEFEKLLYFGEVGNLGYTTCKLTLSQYASFLANKSNLDSPTLASLSIRDICKYTRERYFKVDEGSLGTEKTGSFDESSEQSLFDTMDSHEDDTPSDPDESVIPNGTHTGYSVSAAIEELESKDTKNADRIFIKEALKPDLMKLKRAFGNRTCGCKCDGNCEQCKCDTCMTSACGCKQKMLCESEYSFDIMPLSEQDNRGEDVLVGYQIRFPVTKQVVVNKEARICPYCKKKVFQYAGTAEHKSIAFIGSQKSGKTSTILALAHYAENAMLGTRLDDPIWGTHKAIASVASVDLLKDDSAQGGGLAHDLSNYEKGIVPEKTRADQRADAYCATFRIRSKAQTNYSILTLTDLPGELCVEDTGEIDYDKIINHFPIALACDAFVLCFDSTATTGGRAQKLITNICHWANDFQGIRENYKKYTKDNQMKGTSREEKIHRYAPVMILFTKCAELEALDYSPAKIPQTDRLDFIKSTYFLKNERVEIDQNDIYKDVGKRIKEYERLKNAYTARLRCSPFGFAAGSEGTESQAHSSTEKSINRPRPKNIDKLMRWLLVVSGCIPSDAVYRPSANPNDPNIFQPLNNFIVRPQYRAMIPYGEKNEDVLEALNRCFLFENPGKYDKEFLQNYDKPWILAVRRTRSHFDSN